ncbi:hypothetical protein HK405_001983, partial [Cladochytrium tenue]
HRQALVPPKSMPAFATLATCATRLPSTPPSTTWCLTAPTSCQPWSCFPTWQSALPAPLRAASASTPSVSTCMPSACCSSPCCTGTGSQTP